jgi:hypothetical protein
VDLPLENPPSDADIKGLAQWKESTTPYVQPDDATIDEEQRYMELIDDNTPVEGDLPDEDEPNDELIFDGGGGVDEPGDTGKAYLDELEVDLNEFAAIGCRPNYLVDQTTTTTRLDPNETHEDDPDDHFPEEAESGCEVE